ncbi:MAG: GNAT family N-acetyltransferase [Roseiflexaceae bacterium]
MERLLADYFGGNRDSGHMCLIDEEHEALGVAYCAPARASDGAWDLTMIAVRPEAQGQGRGTVLIGQVEQALRASGQRLLLVETSGLPTYERTRRFYLKCGYEQEARIRDFYTAGEDMVIFRKALDAGAC